MITEAHIPIVTQMIMDGVNVVQAFSLNNVTLDPLTITVLTVIITTLISTVISFLVTKCLNKIWPSRLEKPGPIMNWQLKRLIRNAKEEALNQHSDDISAAKLDASQYDLETVAYNAIVNAGPAIYTRFA